jgi:ferric-dicitrate binding protein FerR (iron transport regulator)
MQLTREQERLIHVLLLEQLGGETPPDLTDRVLRRTLDVRRRRFRRLIPAAAAAGILLAMGAWALLGPRGYPSPEASGDYRIVKGERLQRGAVIATGDGSAAVVLGGYCHLDLGPQSRVRLQGQKHAEEVFLETGSATCEVDRNIGTFTVRTEVGTVSVKGTRFTVRILESEGDEQMVTKQMVVKVLVGAVIVSGAWGSTAMLAGEEKVVTAATGATQMATQRITIRGMGKALGDPSGNLNPSVANATVTVTKNGVEDVYYVYGWAGVIVAKKGDGKMVEVTGYVGVKDGKKTITGRSVDVKIIVVE